MTFRRACGIAALMFLAVALNLLVWRQDPFAVSVVLPLVLSVVLGVVWLGLVFRASAGRTALEGRAAGGVNAVVSSLVFLGICVVIYAFAQAWDVSWDLTQEGRRQLSPLTKQVLQTMTEEVEVFSIFPDSEDEIILIARDKTRRFLEQCGKHTALLRMTSIDPQTEPHRLEELALTHYSPQGTVVLRAGTRKRVITLAGGSPRLEERDFVNSLVNVLRDVEPKVGFLTGHSEMDVLSENARTGGSMLRNMLLGESYQVERVAISLSDPHVPEDCDILVIADPKHDLHPQEVSAIQAYLDRGGRLFLLLNPWRSVRQGYSTKEQMRPWLEERYGIQVGSDLVYSDRPRNGQQVELTPELAPFADVEDEMMAYRGSFHTGHPVTKALAQTLLFPRARTVRADPMKEGIALSELLRTPPDYWAESDVERWVETGKATREEGEAMGPLSLAVAARAVGAGEPDERGQAPMSRIVVVGNADFVTNGRLSIPGHFNFALNTFGWLSERQDLIAIRPTGKEDPPLVLTDAQKGSVAWISTMFTLQLVVGAGLVVYAVRRRNQ